MEIALKRDLKYDYGAPGNKGEKLQANKEIEFEQLTVGAPQAVAELMFNVVDTFGEELFKTDFSWGLRDNNKFV